MDELEDPLLRLQTLQRDLNSFTETGLRSLERLQTNLDASQEALRGLLQRNRKSDESRTKVDPKTDPQPTTLTIDNVDYSVQAAFRQNALSTADALDLDELEAAKLCIRAQREHVQFEDSMGLAMQAVLLFHEERLALLECLRALLYLGVDQEVHEDLQEAFRVCAKELIQKSGSEQDAGSAYWRKCLEGLSDIEAFIAKVAAEKDKAMMTGEDLSGTKGNWLVLQGQFLSQQHESMASVLSYLIQGHWVLPEDYRGFLSKAASLEAPIDIVIHYLPPIISGSIEFASDHNTTPEAAKGLHSLFATGPGQLQWRQAGLKAAATVCWLAEYNARFGTDAVSHGQSPSSQSHEDEARAKLFFDSLADKAFHFLLSAAAYLKPVVWYDPARLSIVQYLVGDSLLVRADAPRPTPHFTTMTMRDLQTFSDALVTNMPDTLRRLKSEEDDNRRALLSQSVNIADTALDLERFMVIIAYAYHDDALAANDFWADRESNMYGFLRWTSQRLPTPRVAAFCLLLQSIACDAKTADQAHRFLLEDVSMNSGKMRKLYAVSWAQIFSELELYASSLKDRPAAPQTGTEETEPVLEEYETHIMLEAYLGLATRVCDKSPAARNWLLREQSFHLGEVMFQLLRSANHPRVKTCCLNLLTAMLTDKSVEVRNGMWVMLDSWISGGGLEPSAPKVPGRNQFQAKHYLSAYALDAEAAAAMVAFLNALTSSIQRPGEQQVDQLPYPEALGRPHRHEGIHVYIDFIMNTLLARRVPGLDVDDPLLNLLRYECLQFAFQCLSTFNEDIVLLANTTSLDLDSALETKSFTRYATLHPFSRVMEWIFDKNVAASLFDALRQNMDALNDADPHSPLVQATLKAAQVIRLAWKLQPTYFDLVRPAIVSSTPRIQPISPTWTSIDEIFISHLSTVADIAEFTSGMQLDIALECLALLEKIGSSRKLSEVSEGRQGGRIIGVLAPINDGLTSQLASNFHVLPWDLEIVGEPPKVLKARAILDLLKASLKTSNRVPGMAHGLLGFQCRERTVEILRGSPFDNSASLFNWIAKCACLEDTITDAGHTSWLLSLKRGCLEVILRLAVHPLTSRLVQPVLRAIDFLGAVSKTLTQASAHHLWDGKSLTDFELLRHSSTLAIRDFMGVRRAFFEFAATDLRTAAGQGAYSVQEKIASVLLGTVKTPTGEELPTLTIFDLFDFFDIETPEPYTVSASRFFQDEDMRAFLKDDPETITSFDVDMARMSLLLRKKQLKESGLISDTSQEEAAENEMIVIPEALRSNNSHKAILFARLNALEAWTDLVSMLVTNGGMEQAGAVAFSLQGLLLTLPKFEKSLVDNIDAAALLAKLVLTFTQAIIPASQASSEQTASVAIERLLSTFRVSLKVIVDSSTDLVLRDVAYRTCSAVLASMSHVSTSGRNSRAASMRQLLQLVHKCGERLFAVATEDAFSGRGVTRVSALLFLDGLIALFQSLKSNAQMLRRLIDLNFVPVLIDTGIGNVAGAFQTDDETITTIAFYHTAMTLLLRLCKSSDGTQLVLNSGLFAAIEESKLFSTDPDIGLDIENPAALKEFYTFLGDVVRLMTATVVQKGAQHAKAFLQQHRFTVQAILKQATRGQAMEVAEELCKLLMATGFLEDDQALAGTFSKSGFT